LLTNRQIFRYAVPARTVTKKSTGRHHASIVCCVMMLYIFHISQEPTVICFSNSCQHKSTFLSNNSFSMNFLNAPLHVFSFNIPRT